MLRARSHGHPMGRPSPLPSAMQQVIHLQHVFFVSYSKQNICKTSQNTHGFQRSLTSLILMHANATEENSLESNAVHAGANIDQRFVERITHSLSLCDVPAEVRLSWQYETFKEVPQPARIHPPEILLLIFVSRTTMDFGEGTVCSSSAIPLKSIFLNLLHSKHLSDSDCFVDAKEILKI